MQKLNFEIILFSILVCSAFIAGALWKNKHLTHSNWLQTSAGGVFLGCGAIVSICMSKILFAVIITGYIINFYYLKYFADPSIKNTCTMLSLVAGVVVGFSGMLQWCYNCA
ncbi:MAG: hypothetical protein V4732_12885 [Pseudomonadota bacterium]